jgi:hypothetical protein
MSIPPPSPTAAPPKSAATPTASMKNSGADVSPEMSDADLGAVERPDDPMNWKDAYADRVGISRWREL